jgi:ergothioneine biosynthesis protein EgtB
MTAWKIVSRDDAPAPAHSVPEHLQDRFAAVRAATRSLAAPLSAEDCALQSMPDASPVKWHLAHTTWFFETFVLQRFLRGYRPFDPAFRVLYNSYYNSIGERHPRPERGLLSRPSLDEVIAYRAHVDACMAPLFATASANEELAQILELGLQHEQQHQELILTDVKHLLSRNPLAPAYRRPRPLPPHAPPLRRWIAHEGGLAEVGANRSGFAFDNELPRHRVYVAPFELASHPVTNREYLAIIDDGGYRRPELWLALGWDLVLAQKWEAPLYWDRRDGSCMAFSLAGRIEVAPDTPLVHVSLFEADAFARWAGARLPTEFEWEVAARDARVDGNFLDSGALHPLPPDVASPETAPAQMFGDVWEWTQSSYAPYPGFAPAPGAVGEYNGKFMCNQYVLRGGSCATPRSHIRATYRNFFPPDARWQFSGVRLARSVR